MTPEQKEKAEEMKNTLVTLIMNELSFEFEEKHLARNLIDTITVTYIGNNVYINIPAEAYNMSKYIKTEPLPEKERLLAIYEVGNYSSAIALAASIALA